MKLPVTLIAFLALTFPAMAGSAEDIGVEYAIKAMDRGYGSSCNLAMEISQNDAYYRCIDFGPYRVVEEYQKVSAYVVGPDMQPFKIMEGPSKQPVFTVGGPWEQDFAMKAVSFWNEVVEGGKSEAEHRAEAQKAKDTAVSIVQKGLAENGGTKDQTQGKSPVETVPPSTPNSLQTILQENTP